MALSIYPESPREIVGSAKAHVADIARQTVRVFRDESDSIGAIVWRVSRLKSLITAIDRADCAPARTMNTDLLIVRNRSPVRITAQSRVRAAAVCRARIWAAGIGRRREKLPEG